MAADADLTQRLSKSAASVGKAASVEDLDAVRRYQGLERTYELVNDVLRGRRDQGDLSDDDAEVVQRIVLALDHLVGRWQTPEPIVVHRGQRSARRGTGDLGLGLVFESQTFLSASIHRQVALDEFTVPPGEGGPVLLEMLVPEGTPALWVPPLGDPALAYQGELVLGRGTRLLIRGREEQAAILLVDCEVLP